MNICIYLRKSRSDEEIEKRLGEGETLQKHRNMLLKYAKENNHAIMKIYEEIVSGESLFHRPAMLELLKEIEANQYDAVLCVDIDRLGRGNMQEQGIILETFKKSKTKIITLRKTYDLEDDYDEEYSEFEAFMSRKELKLINRRLQRGRLHSVQEGNYIGTYAPYGYIKSDNTLVPHPDQAPIVQLIFDMYTKKNIGTAPIAKHLNEIGTKSYTNLSWTGQAISQILNNRVYSGKICWKKKESVKSLTQNKRRDTKTRPEDEWIIVQGKHPALVSEETFELARNIKQSRFQTPVRLSKDLANPMAGLIRCKICDSKMLRRPYRNQVAHFRCPNQCGNKSTRFEYVEKSLIEIIKQTLDTSSSFELNKSNSRIEEIDVYLKTLQSLQVEKEKLEKQKLNLHDLLEQNIYDINTFVERSNNIASRISDINNSTIVLQNKIDSENKKSENEVRIEEAKSILKDYLASDDIIEKNQHLKKILEKAYYYKSKDWTGNNFILEIKPRWTIF